MTKTVRQLFASLVLLLVLTPVVLTGFQNCADKNFAADPGSPKITDQCVASTCTPDPNAPYALIDHVVQVDFNTPKTWVAPNHGDRTEKHVSLASGSDLTTLVLPNQGRVEITNANGHELRFTPDFGFRGQVTLPIYALDSSSTQVSTATVTLMVGNSVNFFQPALAIRGVGCVLCHANVQSNIVTDLGLGDPYYFGQGVPANPGFTWNGVNYQMSTTLSWNHGAIYGDHDAFYVESQGMQPGALASLVHRADRQVFAAKAPVPIQEARDKSGGQMTLAGYLTQRFAASVNPGTAAPNKVVERNAIYIGAPTASRLLSVFGWSSGMNNIVYQADTGGGVAFSGIGAGTGYYKNTGTLVCEGDLLVHGTLMLQNLDVQTRSGCRIYATGPVFIYGPINYVRTAGDDLRNLQITSSRAVLMGLGKIYDNANNHCEQNAPSHIRWYWDQKQPSNYNAATQGMDANTKALYDKSLSDTAFNRLFFFWPLDTYFTRGASTNPRNEGLAIYNELVNKIGLPLDAACTPGGRNIGYTRLLLNAPRIESRYNGDFVGSIIAEIALPALGQFKFQFDPVFSNVGILPKLSDSDFLKIE